MEKETIEVTLQQLADMALGNSTLGAINIEMLYTLIDILMKKLGCHQERISVTGSATMELSKMLKKATTSQLMHKSYIRSLGAQFDKLQPLEQQIQIVDAKYEEHCDEIRSYAATQNEPYQAQQWSRFAGSCEDPCTIYQPSNEVACLLMRKKEFIRNLDAVICEPMLKRLQDLEDKLGRVQKFLQILNKHMLSKEYKVETIKMCITQLEHQSFQNQKNEELFTTTMKEVQEMLEAKLGKIHVPPTKQFVRMYANKFTSDIMSVVQDLFDKEIRQTIRVCPKAKTPDYKCMLCSSGDSEVQRFSDKYKQFIDRKINCKCSGYMPSTPLPSLTHKLAEMDMSKGLDSLLSHISFIGEKKSTYYDASSVFM